MEISLIGFHEEDHSLSGIEILRNYTIGHFSGKSPGISSKPYVFRECNQFLRCFLRVSFFNLTSSIEGFEVNFLILKLLLEKN